MILLFGLGIIIVALSYYVILTPKINVFVKFFLVLGLTLFFTTLAFIREGQISKKSIESKLLAPIASPIEKGVAAIHYITKVQGLETVIKPLVQNEKGIYGIGIKNLKTGDEYYYNEAQRFQTASIYKLWVMATVFQYINDGKLFFGQTLSQNVTDLNQIFEIASESAELQDGTVSFTVSDAIEQMIEVSSNYAAYLLTYAVKITPINNFIHALGLTNSNLESDSYTTVTDTILFYEKLYHGEIVSPTASQKMLEILKKQQLDDRIPKYLPSTTVVAHKTGELDTVKHDAGIVYSPKGDYIIVLFSDTPDLVHAAEVEAQISKKVWDYFNR